MPRLHRDTKEEIRRSEMTPESVKLTPQQIIELVWEDAPRWDDEMAELFERVADAATEKAIREVVEWIKHPSHKGSCQSGTYYYYNIGHNALQAKLKKLGYEQ